FNELSLRLISFVASIGSLVLFWRLARKCLTGVPQLLAIALFSVTYAGIRYSAEAKPYGLDLFFALMLINFAVNWLQESRNLWLWVMTATIPLAIAFSYGSILLGGGLSLGLGWIMWRQRRRQALVPWLAFSAALGISFLAQYFLFMRTQMTGELSTMRVMW